MQQTSDLRLEARPTLKHVRIDMKVIAETMIPMRTFELFECVL